MLNQKSMKRFSTLHLIALSLLTFLTAFNREANAQWQQLTGLKGEPCYYIRATSTELFTGISAGVLSSSNNGNLWAKEPALYLTNVTDRISTSGDTIVVFADPQSYLSLDNGVTWTEIDNPAGGAVYVTGMITEDGMLYAGTDGDYFYRSSDWGATWTQIISNITNSVINFTAAFDNTVFLATDDGIFRSTDAGVTFTLSSQTVPGPYNFVYSDGTTAFAYGSNNIVKSTNNGVSWIPFNSPILYSEITDFLVDGTTVFAATYDKLMQSAISSPAWTEVIIGPGVDFCFGLCIQNGEMFASTSRGIFSTSNQGVSWTEKNDGITPLSIDGLTVHGDALFAGASIYGISTYQNNTWDFSGLGLLNSFDFHSQGTDIYAANELGIYKSADTGTTWNVITPLSGGLPSFCVKVTASDSLVLGAAIQNGVLRSGDFGVNWTVENNGLSGTQVSSVGISGPNIVVGTYANGLYLSTDAGFTWNFATASGEYISDITTFGNNVLASTYGAAGCYLSTDNGATWTPMSTVSFDDLSTSPTLVVASTTSDIYLSEDFGLSFLPPIPGPVNVSIANSVASDTTLYVSTFANGVWKASISELLSVRNLSQQSGFSIAPNVFTDEAMIIADNQLLTTQPVLTITDINGKTLRKIRLQQTHTRLQALDLAPGIYFCSILQNGSKVMSQKFVIY